MRIFQSAISTKFREPRWWLRLIFVIDLLLIAIQWSELQTDMLIDGVHWRGLYALIAISLLFIGLAIISFAAYDRALGGLRPVIEWIVDQPFRTWVAAFIVFQIPVLVGLAIDRHGIFSHGSEMLGVIGFVTAVGILLAKQIVHPQKVDHEQLDTGPRRSSDRMIVLTVVGCGILTAALIWLYAPPLAYGNFDSYRYFYASEGLLRRQPLHFFWYTYPYPLLIAATRLIADSVLSIVILQHVLRIAFAALIFWLIKGSQRGIAAVAALLVALSPLSAYQAHQLLDTSIYSVCIGLIGVMGFVASQKERQVNAGLLVAIGLICAWVAVMRPLGQLLILPTLVVVGLFAWSWKLPAWIIGGFVVGALIMAGGQYMIDGHFRLGTDEQAFYAFPTVYLGLFDKNNGPEAASYQKMMDSGECDYTLPDPRWDITKHWPHDLHNCSVRYNAAHGTQLSTRALYIEAIRAELTTFLSNFYDETRLAITNSDETALWPDRFKQMPFIIPTFSNEDACKGEKPPESDIVPVDSWGLYTCTYSVNQQGTINSTLPKLYDAMLIMMQPYRLEGQQVWSRFWAALALIAFALIEGPKSLRALVLICGLFIAYHAAVSVIAMFPQPRYMYFNLPFFFILVAVILVTVWRGIRKLPLMVGQAAAVTAIAILPILPGLTKPLWVDTVWHTTYYQTPHLVGLSKRIDEDVITHEWGKKAPFPGWARDGFSVRWTRTDLFQNGTYTFAIREDDGARVILDGEVIYENWQPGSHDWTAIQKVMREGRHKIVVEYFEDTGEAFIQFGYSKDH